MPSPSAACFSDPAAVANQSSGVRLAIVTTGGQAFRCNQATRAATVYGGAVESAVHYAATGVQTEGGQPGALQGKKRGDPIGFSAQLSVARREAPHDGSRISAVSRYAGLRGPA